MKSKRIITLATAVVLALSNLVPTNAALALKVSALEAPSSVGTTYYVSTLDGKDSNNGTSEDSAFYSLQKISELTLQPGDRILLERGSVFTNGYLHLYNQKGTAENPIVIDAYGDEQKAAPLIETNGQGIWYQDYGKQLDNARHVYKGYVSSSVLLYDTEYVEVQNIAMTNDTLEVDTAYNALDAMNRTGVAAVAQNGGTLDHIYLKNLDISNVKGNVYDKHMNNGGIYFTVFQPKNEAETGIARYNDILIENCKLDNVNRWGIAVGYTAYHDRFNAAEISDETIAAYGATNVVIKNNYVKDAGGDAITTMYCDRPVIEYNVSDGVARQINPTDYSETDFGRVAAGIWPWKCKNALFQYNEAFDTCQNQDGQAWDADWGDGTLYQYNYSHNNSGGAVMFCGIDAVNNTFRYNISQNDLGGVINPAGNPDAHVYNNVFYVKEGVPFIRSGMSGGNMTVENNIIYYSGEEPRTEDWYLETSQDKAKYDNNLYYNYANTPANDANPVVVQKGTPVFVDPGKAPNTPNSVVNDRTAFDGYKLAENSPAINAGKVITDANGYAVEKDFFGNNANVASPDVGAHETNTPALGLSSNVYTIDNDAKTILGLASGTTVQALLQDLIYDEGIQVSVHNAQGNALGAADVVLGDCTVVVSYNGKTATYTFVLSSDATLHGSIFEVKEKEIFVPSVEKNPTSIKTVAGGMEVDRGASITFENNGQPVESGSIADGMTVTITAQDQSAKEQYTIRVKNEYHYVNDFVPNQQGNLWFAQEKTNAGTYVNLTEYNDGYGCWTGTSWASVGLNTKDGEFGLLCDSVGQGQRQGGHSMAYRVPVTGTVTLTFEDFEGKGNVYLRQPGNTGGQVYLQITLNGEPLMEKVNIPDDQSGVELQDQTVKVSKGDYLRVEAINEGNPTKASMCVTPIVRYENVEPPEADKSALSQQVDLALTLQQADYTADSWAVFAGALQQAQAVLADTAATQETVDAACEALVQAMAALVKSADKTALGQLIEQAKKLNQADYTASTWALFAQALQNAQTVWENANATEAQVNSAYTELERAMMQLAKPADKTALNQLIEQAKALKEADYTADSWKVFTDALQAAVSAAADANLSQTQVDAAYHALNQAMASLVKPDAPTYSVQKGTLNAVPESLKAMYGSVEDMIAKMLSQAQTVLSTASKEASKLFDVNLMVKDANGQISEVLPENFPALGVVVEIPFSDLGEGINSTNCNFVVTHMLEHDTQTAKAGDVEIIAAETTATGLRFVAHSLSPIMVSWAGKTPAPVTGGTSSGTAVIVQTGDSAQLAAWGALALCSAAAIIVTHLYAGKGKRKK